MSYKQTIISSAIAMNVFNVKTCLLPIPTEDEKRELHVDFRVKVQRSTFRRLSGCTYFLTGYFDNHRSVFLLTLYTGPGR